MNATNNNAVAMAADIITVSADTILQLRDFRQRLHATRTRAAQAKLSAGQLADAFSRLDEAIEFAISSVSRTTTDILTGEMWFAPDPTADRGHPAAPDGEQPKRRRGRPRKHPLPIPTA